jgi:hypothetical protein
MKDIGQLIHFVKQKNHGRFLGQRGIAAVEFAMILIPLLIMIFAIIDFGRLIQARLVVTNLSREGGSLASRDIESAGSLIGMLQAGASPLNLAADGEIWITKIKAGTCASGPACMTPDPYIDTQVSGGAPLAASSIGTGQPNLGLSPQLYDHLVFDPDHETADISEVTVVEVFYKYKPITPISKPIFISGLLTDSSGGTIISSKAVF